MEFKFDNCIAESAPVKEEAVKEEAEEVVLKECVEMEI